MEAIQPANRNERAKKSTSKKSQIQALFLEGITSVEDLAIITHVRPSYVAGVLQEAGLRSDYFDLYTPTKQPMNVYSKFFAGQLGFKDVEAARQSVEVIDDWYRRFDAAGDRAGQHHALLMALTMLNRARWTGKEAEADEFRHWLLDRLSGGRPDASNGMDQPVAMSRAAPAAATPVHYPPGGQPRKSKH
jgi:hypothetical protein